MNAGRLSSQFCHRPDSPWIHTSGGFDEPPVSINPTMRPSICSVPSSQRQLTSNHVESSPSAYSGSAPGRINPLRATAASCRCTRAMRRRTVPAAVRIAIDIDSTLHHYWDTLAAVAKKRFGVDLPYELQTVWEIDSL